jgi:AbrB family looped-hinge helix DNA binding protein
MSETRPFFKSRLRGRGQITLPTEIRARLNVQEGDDVLFYVNEQGQIVITQAQIIDPTQAWFWTERWQKAEMESRQDYLSGNFVEFGNMESAIRHLNELDKEEAKSNAEG